MFESIASSKPAWAAVALAALWLLEGAVPMFEGRRERGRHDLGNLALGLFNAAVTSIAFAGTLLLTTEWAAANSFGLLHRVDIPTPWSAVAAFLLIDWWQYVWHRMNHRVPLLWRFHAVHHADPDVDASTALRFHTVEIALSSAARLAVLPLLGVTMGQLLVYETILLPVIFFHHGNVRLPAAVDRLLRGVIVTPRMHWVHHSDWQPETDSNYSSVLSIWDRVFGSFRLRDDPSTLSLGLSYTRPDEERSIVGMLFMPFRPRNRDSAGPEPGPGP